MNEPSQQPEFVNNHESANKSQKATPLKQVLFVFLICFLGAIVLKGWRAFFVGIGISPALTIAELIGAAFVQFAFGGIIALALSIFLKKISLQKLWIIGSITCVLISLIGQFRAGS